MLTQHSGVFIIKFSGRQSDDSNKRFGVADSRSNSHGNCGHRRRGIACRRLRIPAADSWSVALGGRIFLTAAGEKTLEVLRALLPVGF